MWGSWSLAHRAVALVLLTWVALLISGCGRSAESWVDQPGGRALVIGQRDLVHARQSISVLNDPEGNLDLEGVRRSAGWSAPSSDPRFDVSAKAGWARLSVKNASQADVLVIWQGHPWPMRLQFFLPDGSIVERDGTRVPGAYPRTGFTTRLSVPHGDTATIYVRYAGRLQAPTLLVGTQAAFDEGYASSNLAHGVFYGILLALLLYNLVLWVLLRSPAYGYYVLHVAVTLWYFLARNMHIAEAAALRPIAAAMGPHPRFWTVTMLWVSAIAMTGFCRHLLDTRRHIPRIDRALRWVPAVPAIGMASLLFTDGTYSDGLAALAQILALFVILLAAIQRSRAGDRLARLFLTAWSMYLVTGITYSMRYFGFFPYTNWTEHLLQLGSGLEVVLLSLALGYRIRLLDSERQRAKEEATQLRLERGISLQRERARGLALLLEQQDQDRRRIARDLHDGLGQLFVVLKGVLAGERSTAADRARELVARGIEESRALSHGLHPDRLDRLGLTAALRGLLDDLPEQPGLIVDAEIRDVDGVLERSAELHLFRIAQEAVNNAFVHGQARHIYVSVERAGDELCLVVENDGKSFKPGRDARGEGLGLTGIRERCAAMGASFGIEAVPEGGTRLEVTLPLPSQAQPLRVSEVASAGSG